MSKPKRDQDESNRTHKVTVRFTDDEHEQLGVISVDTSVLLPPMTMGTTGAERFIVTFLSTACE